MRRHRKGQNASGAGLVPGTESRLTQFKAPACVRVARKSAKTYKIKSSAQKLAVFQRPARAECPLWVGELNRSRGRVVLQPRG